MTMQIPQYLQNKVYPARQDRQVMGGGLQPGVGNEMGSGLDFYCLPTANTREISVYGGVAYVQGNTVANQGMYRVFNDSLYPTAAYTFVHDAVTTYPRVDQIIVRVQDAAENGNVGPDIATVEIVKGVETSGATLDNRSGAIADASLPKNCLRICDVLITVGMTTIGSNFRLRRTYARGGRFATNLGYDSALLSSTPVACGLSSTSTYITVEAGAGQEIYYDYAAHFEATSTTSSLITFVECTDPSGTIRTAWNGVFKGGPSYFGPGMATGARMTASNNDTARVQYWGAPGRWKFRLMALAAAGTGYVRYNSREATFNIYVVNRQQGIS